VFKIRKKQLPILNDGKGIITTHIKSGILVIEVYKGRFQPMQLRKHLGVDLINKPKLHKQLHKLQCKLPCTFKNIR